MEEKKGSILLGSFWMVILSILLGWLPGLGSLIAGGVGGKVAGGVAAALLAALLPAILLAVGLFFLGANLSGLPVIGVIAGAGVFVLILVQIGPLLLGAIIGGLLA